MSAIKKFGLIGHPLGHSLSPYIHKRIMEEAGIHGTYTLYDIEEDALETVVPSLRKELDGFNCTIPYKEKLISFLDSLDTSASAYSAVNTVYKGKGYNTDRAGFLAAAPSLVEKSVLILGAGGVSRMMAYEAAAQNARITICARNDEKRNALIKELQAKMNADVRGFSDISEIEKESFDVLLNGTPVGMWPRAKSMPSSTRIFKKNQKLFDTIYNPSSTMWMMQAQNHGVEVQSGLRMLLLQAVAAQQIWNPEVVIDMDKMLSILPELSKKLLEIFPVKYVFTGYMGTGKTLLANELAKHLRAASYDLDKEIVKKEGISIREIFEKKGEAAFREMETACLEDLLKSDKSAFIALGGGAILQKSTQAVIEKYQAITVYIDSPFDVIWKRISASKNRPLLGDAGMSEKERFTKAAALYEARLPVYEKYSDVKINGNQEKKAVIKEALHILGYGGQNT